MGEIWVLNDYVEDYFWLIIVVGIWGEDVGRGEVGGSSKDSKMFGIVFF